MPIPLNNDDERSRLALAGLAEAPPPAGLEDAVVASLRARGLVRRRRRRLVWLVPAGGLLLAVAIAVALGGRTPPSAGSALVSSSPSVGGSPSGPRFMLLLYESPELGGGHEASHVAEYAAWARSIRARGIDIQGEKLKDGERLLGHSAQKPAELLGGWFIVGVSDEQRAVEIARSCPHLAHGGTISVREIDGT